MDMGVSPSNGMFCAILRIIKRPEIGRTEGRRVYVYVFV